MLGLKICQVSKLFVSKKIMVQDIQGQCSKPNFDPKKKCGQKKIWVQNQKEVPKIFGQEKFLVQKVF